MNKFATLDRDLLTEVKRGFVSMPQGADPSIGAGPVAGGGMLTQGQASPMGGTPQMDPSMAGGMPPTDPSMGGAPPTDPSMGGMPPTDPSMGGMSPTDPSAGGGAPPDAGAGAPMPGGQIVMSTQDLIQLIQALQSGGAKAPKAKPAGDAGAAGGGDTNSKLDQIISILGGNMVAGAQGGAAGGQPPQQ